MIMEVCVDNLESVLNAEQAGASRIELCSALSEGGLTPSLGIFKVAKSLSKMPIHVLIRPRGGDFLYTDAEVDIMASDAESFAKAGADGLVIGCLKSDGNVDVEACMKIMQKVNNYCSLNWTFHRAFDVAKDAMQAAKVIKDMGFSRILTSGQAKNAFLGRELIKELIENLQDVIFMPGGGINSDNLQILLEETKAKEFHASARHEKPSGMTFQNENCKMGTDSKEYSINVTSQEKVRNLVAIFQDYTITKKGNSKHDS